MWWVTRGCHGSGRLGSTPGLAAEARLASASMRGLTGDLFLQQFFAVNGADTISRHLVTVDVADGRRDVAGLATAEGARRTNVASINTATRLFFSKSGN